MHVVGGARARLPQRLLRLQRVDIGRVIEEPAGIHDVVGQHRDRRGMVEAPCARGCPLCRSARIRASNGAMGLSISTSPRSMHHVEADAGHALGDAHHADGGMLVPFLRTVGAGPAAPQIDHRLAFDHHRGRRAEFLFLPEILDERLDRRAQTSRRSGRGAGSFARAHRSSRGIRRVPSLSPCCRAVATLTRVSVGQRMEQRKSLCTLTIAAPCWRGDDAMHDVIIVGGGPTGFVTALGLAQAGVEVLLIEAEAGHRREPARRVYHWSMLDGLERLGIREECERDRLHQGRLSLAAQGDRRGVRIRHLGRRTGDAVQLQHQHGAGQTGRHRPARGWRRWAMRRCAWTRASPGWRRMTTASRCRVETPDGPEELRAELGDRRRRRGQHGQQGARPDASTG